MHAKMLYKTVKQLLKFVKNTNIFSFDLKKKRDASFIFLSRIMLQKYAARDNIGQSLIIIGVQNIYTTYEREICFLDGMLI